MRIAAGIEYDGSGFRGWQAQSDWTAVRTVQAAVEAAISRVADHPLEVVCAGRTDAGVHAAAQVIHFDTQAVRTERSWVLGVNSHLPPDVSLLWARPVDEGFHARFAAQSRSYRYVILNRGVRPAILARRVSWFRHSLDAQRMQAGAVHLLGEHDFSSFRAVACQARHPVRTIHEITVTREGEFVHIDVTANAFLHHMVRNIAGVLMAVGCGDREPGWVQKVLGHRDRTQGGVTAPPDGLYLAGVRYEARFGLPGEAVPPRFC